jgi:hypothetical protein
MAQDETIWAVDGRYVTLNGDPYLFKGINYSPIPIGAGEDETSNRGDVFTAEYDFIHSRDLPAIRATGANSIRLYDVFPWKYPSEGAPEWTEETDLDHTDFLDACWNGGENPIYVWMTHHMGTSFHVATSTSSGSPDGRPTWRLSNGRTAYLDPAWDAADGAARAYTRNAFVSLATKYGTHPAIAGFVVSNEQNTDMVRGSWQFWKWFDETAQLVKTMAPQKLTSMTIVDDAMLSVTNAESFGIEHIDSWGINSYRGTVNSGFDNLFSTFAAVSNRPLFIGEYGPPASTRNGNNEIVEMEDNAKAQADYIKVHWEDLLENRDVCSGGFIFEWTDEWWKAGFPTTQDASNAPNGAYPGGWGDEEWFGLNAVSMIAEDADPAAFLTRGADVLRPRAAVATLTELYTAPDAPLPPQAPPSPIAIIPIEPLAPFAPTTVPQNVPQGPNPSPIAEPTEEPSAPNAPTEAPTDAPTTAPQTANNPSSPAPSLAPDFTSWVCITLSLFTLFTLMDTIANRPLED